jgi:hypothetical protein
VSQISTISSTTADVAAFSAIAATVNTETILTTNVSTTEDNLKNHVFIFVCYSKTRYLTARSRRN